jgi:hypothetical protein
VKFLHPSFAIIFFITSSHSLLAVDEYTRVETDLSGGGWKLWLDKDAKWENDPLFLPPVDIAKLPVNPPTGGWDSLAGREVSVPGTVEEYMTPGTGPAGDYKGVSWWWRTIRIPYNAGPRIALHFESQRHRAEIFLDHQLVGYDVIGGTPFDVDLTGKVKPNQEYQLAVRITDPGGNYDWRDSSPFKWGNNVIPMSHAFGGITGPVKLVATDPVFIDDIYVQNSPAITNATAFVTVKNTLSETAQRDVHLTVVSKAQMDYLKSGHFTDIVYSLYCSADMKGVELKPGDNELKIPIVPTVRVKPWDLENPNLYLCRVDLHSEKTEDRVQQTFGFRWFAPEGIGSNAVFRLNDKRVVVRTSISWGFWPINGIFPTPELAEKQIRDAKDFGMNMLNFHRAIGQPIVLQKADELGLLYYEEPGGYKSADDDFSDKLMREKVQRMVKRDRSHPSLVIYSLINERNQHQPFQARERRDMQELHDIDPSRTITLSSSWATRPNASEDIKAHVRPFDSEIHFTGWFDNHHAGGPEVWRQNLYRSPENFYNRTTNTAEIVYWGEEGAISTPPRLEKIKAALEASPTKGWDGGIYLDWYARFDKFLTQKNLREAFSSVDVFTTAMGDVSLYHQGRKIETMRVNNVTDGYAINGWESESVENHSGIVDCWRNPKGNPAILAYYNQPLYVAVKTRSQFAQIPGNVAVDFYGINEKDLHGDYTLKISVHNPGRKNVFTKDIPVKLTGGEVYGELLAENVTVPIAGATGMFRIEVSLEDAEGKAVAGGRDDVLAVDWKTQKLGGQGATWEGAPQVSRFLKEEKGLQVQDYRDDLGKLDWVVVTRPPEENTPVEIPAARFTSLTATFFNDESFRNAIHTRPESSVDFYVPDGAVPDAQVNTVENFGVRWEGTVSATIKGNYTFATDSNDGVRLWVGGKLLFDDLATRSRTVNRGTVALNAGQSVAVRLEFWHRKGEARCRLLWSPPEIGAPSPAKLIERVRKDGTTLFILDRAETWMNLITNNTPVKYSGSFQIGTAWLGGLHFVRAHLLFKDLPVNVAMDWPYQAVVRNGKVRSGLLLDGEELVAGAWHSYPMELGTAVGIIPCGKGKIIVSTLEIANQLNSTDTSAEVARKLMCNFIDYADGK